MKRLKNLASGIASIIIFLFFPMYLLFNGQLLGVVKNVVLTSCYISLPGGVFSSPVSEISIPQTAAATVFSAASGDNSVYAFSFPEQGFNKPYFPEDSSSQTETTSETYPVTKVTLSPSSSDGYISLKNFLVKDSSTKKPNMDDIFSKKLDLGLKKSESGPQVLILHTHATESYNLDGLDSYTKETSFRTTDITKSVVAVGDVIAEKLKENGINVIHSTVLHDKDSFNGAYGKSLETAENYLKQYPTIKVILDVHRDSMITSAGVNYRPVVSINNTNAAQVMFVVGTGSSALPNDNWKNNLRFAASVQERLQNSYQGLMRPMLLRDSRYNMHLAKGYMLIETGACGNTLDEAKTSAALVGQALADELKEILNS